MQIGSVLGVFQGGELVYIGHTGGGFGTMMFMAIRAKLDPLIRKKCPFRVEPATNATVTWVKPELVCEVAFRGWTGEGIMRQPVFLRLREDKAAREVVRENPGKETAYPAIRFRKLAFYKENLYRCEIHHNFKRFSLKAKHHFSYIRPAR